MAVSESKSVSDQISRLQTAKNAIKTAIEGKGITVPNAALLSAYAELINGIEVGGGAKITTGTHTVASDGANITIEHNLGEIPNFLCVTQAKKLSSEYSITCFVHRIELRFIYGPYVSNFKTPPDITSATNVDDLRLYNIFAYNATANSVKIGIDTNDWTVFRSGEIYSFVIGVL